MGTQDANTELHATLARNWGLAESAGDDASDRSDMLEALTVRVRQLLRSDYQRLVTAMYTLDVDEAQFRRAVEGDESDSPRRVAELILDRELAKIESRRKHAADDAARRLADGT